MPKGKNPKAAEAEYLFRQGNSLVDIASMLEIPQGSVRRWKHDYNWQCERSDSKANVRKKAKEAEAVETALENDGLSAKHQLFCLHYSKSFNATRAYMKAYPDCSYESAMARAAFLMKQLKIKAEIQRLKKDRFSRAMVGPEDVFQKYLEIAFSDITDYVTFGREEVPVIGSEGPLQTRDPETGETTALTREVNTVRFLESDQVDGSLIQEVAQGRDGAKVKLIDRMKALEWLANHMDLATTEQAARVSLLKAQVDKLTGEGLEVEDMDGVEAVIYGDEET